ncbi:hypothetical protein PMI21_03444 [Pseudomonas sp. GM18]|uniref:hypothetical protein n=1 Tax=Pseudomonas sp. GM18 TaxID=1144324 RepID=UPI000272714B|nr:hypothetical protein [Pseudomonas sp. GM18]EJM15016.1 hypothetical protein PMI21_03444 [Pseudomonas sp. GM18]
MNNQSEQAIIRSRLFESLVQRHGAVLIPGRYGGDFNNDQLGFAEVDGEVTLLLGLKILDDEGGLQLDNSSLGPHVQYSTSWLKALIQCLKLDSETIGYSMKIEAAMSRGSLVAGVICMNGKSQEIKMLRVAV